ncbi:dTDP-4-dehydrorhamnose reductase [Cryobacterium mesophilum]|uniref:dTDP-4-dehydrorhamnose reductase n=1 Tax=Terrimesophilobacter mesophilus TaxID=433647 RepID=A0A4R8VAW8_9MICO|nr:dTDP-4-dehydrorhamnose reductase [Terrimesophilobacter mesophilus]MBB5632678.1 dTDP-4-dehydrorhamnose reductase [Terrimesophilobacter mesophilus]TFB79486.1 dTDP-4-dehydrorhamnose reductase [Terrimesophilobacter mesophilus]
MTYLITGAGGMLGQDLQQALAGRPATALGRSDLDVTDEDAVLDAVAGHSVVINCAAYTRVDDAETDEDAAFAINATGAGNLARAAAIHGATLVQLSTDYVFDGSATTPYAEDALRHPMSAYGRTKAEGERLALELNPGATYILRTAWLYGAHGPNFAKTMVRLAREHGTANVVSDQLGQPTWTVDVAHQLLTMLDNELPAGVYHATSSGEASWFDFAREVFSLSGFDPDSVKPISSGQFLRPAPRPVFSVLGHEQWKRFGLDPIRDWRIALAEAADQGVLENT